MAAITLSFDNGPTPGVTERVLDILGAHGVHANFFVIGSKAARNQALIERAVREGHLVGGHTFSHSVPFGLLDDASVDREIDDTRRVVSDLGGDGLRFRPYGAGGVIDEQLMSPHGAERLRHDGFTCVLWNSVPGDWLDAHAWFDIALADISTRDWSVVVLHDLRVGAVDRLGEFIVRLCDDGHHFELDTPDECTPIRQGKPTRSYPLLGAGTPT